MWSVSSLWRQFLEQIVSCSVSFSLLNANEEEEEEEETATVKR